jgi:hypothetical protein
MKKLHINRMRRLIKFLRNLPADNFSFGCVNNGEINKDINIQKCGAVGCAIGWTPYVFPKILQYEPGTYHKFCFLKGDANSLDYEATAARLFGLTHFTATRLFTPNSQSTLNLKNVPFNAEPDEVADMLEKFLETQI